MPNKGEKSRRLNAQMPRKGEQSRSLMVTKLISCRGSPRPGGHRGQTDSRPEAVAFAFASLLI